MIRPDGAGSQPAQVEQYVYDGSNVLLQFDGGNTTTPSHRYIFGPAVDQVLADQTPSGLDWLVADYEGSIRDLVDAVYLATRNGMIRP